MAKRRILRERRRARSIGDELAAINRGLIYAQVEGVAALADVARQFWSRLLEDDFLYESETEGEFIRRTPRATENASRSAMREVADIPEHVIDTFYEQYHRWQRPRTSGPGGPRMRSLRRSSHASESRPAHGALPEREMVAAAQDYLEQMPSRTSTESGLIDHVTLATGHDRDTVQTIIRRHFVVENGLVHDETRVRSAALEDDVELRMRNILKDYGYTDIRYNVDLADIDDTAALVAFTGDKPAVLCYPVEDGVKDLTVREYARVQALSIGDGPARVVWVSDGYSDYFLDTERGVALPHLPRAASLGEGEVGTPAETRRRPVS